MKLYMSDLYRVELHYPLDEVQLDTLYYLYQPLMGTQALSLYMMLYTEGKRMKRFLKPSSLSRLLSFVSVNLMDLEKSIKVLEAMGLLKTFVKSENEMTRYIFILQSPLSLKAFFKNQILLSLLEQSLTNEDFQNTLSYFQTTLHDLSTYEDITAKFTDVFTIQHHKLHKPLKIKQDLFSKQIQDISVSYDIEFLRQCLIEYQIPKSLFEKDLTFISQLGLAYSIDGMTLASLVRESMTSQELDKQLLKTKIKNYCEIDSLSSFQEVYHKQPLQYQSDSHQKTPLSLHMQHLDKITPFELLQEKQGGKEPTYHDLQIAETLMMQLGLQPAVVNVILEYVLGKNNGRLSKRYCEAIGGSMVRNKVQTAMDAYNELMKIRENKQDVEIKHEIEDIKEEDQLNPEEVEALLKELREEMI